MDLGSNTQKKPRILIVGEANSQTGYARVIESIFAFLHDDFDLHQMATRNDGEAVEWLWPLYCTQNENDGYGVNLLRSLVKKIEPDIVFILYDISYQAMYMSILNDMDRIFKIVNYVPVESRPIDPIVMQKLGGSDAIVSFTETANKEILKALSQIADNANDSNFPKLYIIPHGIDREVFYPIHDNISIRRKLSREKVFPKSPELQDAFIILNANRNYPRKQIDLTLKGFALFSQGKPENVKLCLHMSLKGRGWHVVFLARRLGIADRLILTAEDEAHPFISDNELNLLYNACDAGMNTANSEAWGLVNFEHAATGAPQVISNVGAQEEIWEGTAELVDPVVTLTDIGNLSDLSIVSPEDICKSLDSLYYDEPKYLDLASRVSIHVRQNKFAWENVAEKWKTVFQSV